MTKEQRTCVLVGLFCFTAVICSSQASVSTGPPERQAWPTIQPRLTTASGVPAPHLSENLTSPFAPRTLDISRIDSTLPLHFEANRGQTDEQVKFLARGRGYTLFLTPSEAVLSLRGIRREGGGGRLEAKDSLSSGFGGERQGEGAPAVATAETSGLESGSSRVTRHVSQSVLRMRFEGANAKPEVSGLEQLPGVANYFIGNDPEKWRTKIPTYKKVVYEDVYPGIDLAYYGNQGQLEYDLVVAPGADPNQIKLAFEGADRIEVDPATGDLVLTLPSDNPPIHQITGSTSHTMRVQSPLVYQLDENGHKQVVAGKYLIPADSSEPYAKGHQPSTIGFEVASYDRSKPLVVDPVLLFSTYLGGTDGETSGTGGAIALDAAGQIYVAGETASIDFPTCGSTGGTGTAPCEFSDPALKSTFDSGLGVDVFVTKLNASGTAIVYSTFLGGDPGSDGGFGLAVDGFGQAIVTGVTAAPTFPTCGSTGGAGTLPCAAAGAPIQSTHGGGLDVFVTKLNASGSALVYSTFIGNAGNEFGKDIAVDGGGAAYVTGRTDAAGFPGTSATSIQEHVGGVDVFVAKIDSGGTAIEYATYLGTSGFDEGLGIAVGPAGAAYVTGRTDTSGFTGTSASSIQEHVGDLDVFVAKINPGGTAIDYATYLGTTAVDEGHGIAVDAAGAAYVTGRTDAAGFPGTTGSSVGSILGSSIQGAAPGGSEAFVAKINPAGTAIVYATYLGTDGSGDQGRGIAVDGPGAAYVTGSAHQFNAVAFPGISGASIQPNAANVLDAFVAKINPAGTAVDYATYLGTTALEDGEGIAVDRAGNVYVTGRTDAAGFPGTSGSSIGSSLGTSIQGTFAGDSDAFIAKICNDPPGPTPGTWTSTTNNLSVARYQRTSTLLADGRVLIAGGDTTFGAILGESTVATDLFDSSTGLFLATGLLQQDRYAHTATLLANGQVLIVGGEQAHSTPLPGTLSQLSTAELYTPGPGATGSFSAVTATLSDQRRDHTATRLANGQVLIVGGTNSTVGSLSTSEIFDPSAPGVFTTPIGAGLSIPRHFHSATLLADGRVLVVGGSNNGTVLSSAALYDPTTQSFSNTGSLATARQQHRATLLADGRVLITGGFDGTAATASAELYDPAAGTFSSAGNMNRARTVHSATRLSDGRVLIAGGRTTGGSGTFTVEYYDPPLGLFRETGSMGGRRLLQRGTLLPTGRVLLAGGLNDPLFSFESPTATAELYTPNLCGAEADLSVSVSDSPDPVVIGGTLIYTVDVTNDGPDDVTDVTVTKSLPAGVTFDGPSSDPSCSELGSLVTCAVGPVANGATVMVAIGVTVGGAPRILPDPVHAMLVTEFDPDFGNNTGQAQTIVQSLNPEADLSVTVADDVDPIEVGSGNVLYTVTITNNGIDVATGLTLTITPPPSGMTLGTPAPAPGLSATCGPTSCSLSDPLDIGAGATFTVVGTPTAGGAVTVTADAFAAQTDSAPENNTAATSTLVVAAGVNVFTVNSTGDGGDANTVDGICETATAGECTLLAAIQQANATANDPAGPDVIAFDISGAGPHTIQPLSTLPAITDPVIIDGYTQPGASPNTLAAGDNAVLLIQLDGINSGACCDGLFITVGGSRVRGLVINRFVASGILLDSGDGNLIEGNFIGTNASGELALGNAAGILAISSENNTIGGTTPAARNVISGNGVGLRFFSVPGGPTSGNVVQGNYIGINAMGTAPLSNSIGVDILGGANNLIGGSERGQGNVISGNGTNGVLISGTGSTANVVQGNFIGTNAVGNDKVANTANGVVIFGSANNTIGGVVAGARNIISGNGNPAADPLDVFTGNGVLIRQSGATANVVAGNYIGTDVSGLNALGNVKSGVGIYNSASGNTVGGSTLGAGNLLSGNGRHGVDLAFSATGNVVLGNVIGRNAAGTALLGNGQVGVLVNFSAMNNRIGGTLPGEGNTITGNGDSGVKVAAGDPPTSPAVGTSILANSIFGNTRLGIDLGATGDPANGVTPNDPNDGDAGPNNTQNFPVLSAALSSAGGSTIQGSLNSALNTTFRVEFFANQTCDASGHGEGQTFLGFTDVTTSGNDVTFMFDVSPAVPATQVITATATNTTTNDTSEFSACQTVIGDTTAPTIQSITRADASPTNGANVAFTVTFSEPVTDVEAGDFALATTGVAGAAITGVSGGPSAYSVSVSTGTGDGTIRLDVPATATVTDVAGNALAGLPVTSGDTYAIDKVPPSQPVVPDLAAGSDTGTSTTDNITMATTQTFNGTAEPGSTVRLLEGATVRGTAFADGAGVWSMTNVTLPEGVHGLIVTATDPAGNTSVASGELTVTVDLTGPLFTTVPGNIAVARQNASGTPASDPVIAAFLSGATITDNLDGAPLVTTNAPGTFGVGTTPVIFTAADAAGNTSAGQATVTVGDPVTTSLAPRVLQARGFPNFDIAVQGGGPVFSQSTETARDVTPLLIVGATYTLRGKTSAADTNPAPLMNFLVNGQCDMTVAP